MSGILQTLFLGAVATVKDAYFNLVTLLLNTTSTNGAQNNTFLDSSSNNFTITRNGNTTQGTFSPFSQTGWSNYFDGSSYLTAPSNAAFGFGTADYTVEGWVYSTTRSVANTFFANGTDTCNLYIKATTGIIGFYTGTVNDSTTALPLNQWNHIAVSRTGTSLQVYLNGTSILTLTNSTNYATTSFLIGRNNGTEYMNGYISNLRVLKGTALYSGSTITVPTAPLTAITNTSLLTCQSNRFVDNSTNNFTITVAAGTPSVQAFSPFAPTTAYSTSTVGGSGYFDGSGDYLTVPNNTALNLAGTSWTIEFWYYPTALGGSYRSVLCKRQNLSGEWDFGVSNSDYVYFWNGTGYSSSTKPQLNAWNHMAATHDGTNLRLYLNGSLVYGPTAMSITNTTDSVGIGAVPGGGQTIQGYMCSARITKGGALYTGSTYTVPTAPFTTTVSSGTANLLLNYTNAGIYDAAAKNDLETVGNAQVSTTQAKFGTTSMYFDGTGDWLSFPTSQNFGFGTGDFTLEAWIYTTSSATQRIFSFGTGNNCEFLLVNNGSNVYLNFYNGATDFGNSSNFVSQNQWVHVAACRASGTLRLFINGTVSNTPATLSNNYLATSLIIGKYGAGVPDATFVGYMDEIRISKYARYTANFTPPAAAFPVQ